MKKDGQKLLPSFPFPHPRAATRPARPPLRSRLDTDSSPASEESQKASHLYTGALSAEAERIQEELQHPVEVQSRMPLVRPYLHVEALLRLLKRVDKLERVGRMHVVVRRAIVEHQVALQLIGVGHGGASIVARLVLLRDPHIPLRVDGIVV